MKVDSFCSCCNKVSVTYKNKNSEKIDKFCLKCRETYTSQERKQRELNNILGIITPLIKE